MKSIVEENLVTFKELVKKIFAYVCEMAVEMTQIILEDYDKELHADRDRRRYRDKGTQSTTRTTIYGDVTYERLVYQTMDEPSVSMSLTELSAGYLYTGVSCAFSSTFRPCSGGN